MSEHQELKDWIESILEKKLQGNLEETLTDGTVLCSFLNKIKPGICLSNKPKNMFVIRENISNFVDGCRKLGVSEFELFRPDDLAEGKNFKQVVICLYSLGRHLRKNNFEGPCIGPKMSEHRVLDKSNWKDSNFYGWEMGNFAEKKQQGVGEIGPQINMMFKTETHAKFKEKK